MAVPGTNAVAPPGVSATDDQLQMGARAGKPVQRSPAARVLLAAAVLLGVLVPVVLAVVTGGLSIPHNDAWSYSRIAQTFGLTGRIELLGWNRSALFGQFMVLGPLARWLVAQQVFVALLGIVALAAVYDLLVSSLGRARAAFAVLIVAIWPGFGLLATSFMPDVPAMAAMMICLAVGRRALLSGSTWLLAVSTAFGLWGFTIREQALAAPAAVLLLAAVAAWRSRRKRDWIVLCVTGALFLLGALGFELWRQSYGAGDPPVLSVPSTLLQLGGSVVVRGYFLLALGLVPAVLLVARPWRWGRWAILGSLAAFAVAVAAVLRFGVQGFFVGNYLDPAGPYWGAGNGRPATIFPPQLWMLIVAIACGSGVLLAGLVVRRLRYINPVLGVFLTLMVVGNVGSALSGQNLFDRYWLLAMPPLLAVVLSERTAPGNSAFARVAERVPAVAALAGLAAVSLTVTAAGLAYDSARWDAGNRLVAMGIPAVDVNAGLEWNGYRSAVGMVPPGSWTFPGSSSCFIVTVVQRPERPEVMVLSYRPLIVAGTARLWVYDNGCSAP
ncbi:glycosyltransferase family 39 protein [Amycolatopsis sp.]|uniref:glycosyltransferase family 39 protein n=1 Tax=Amycolatopsis sp. TaxID=37632 RepID=UPI002E08FCA6|nr:glycosyltransferase family 39 protein [Amycolatopsis sp.]